MPIPKSGPTNLFSDTSLFIKLDRSLEPVHLDSNFRTSVQMNRAGAMILAFTHTIERDTMFPEQWKRSAMHMNAVKASHLPYSQQQ